MTNGEEKKLFHKKKKKNKNKKTYPSKYHNEFYKWIQSGCLEIIHTDMRSMTPNQKKVKLTFKVITIHVFKQW